MEVETKHARLDTLAVTIQALHVNGKQMTLAVFRQLPVISPYNEDGSLAPMEYWGIVRYRINYLGSVWAVCSTGGRLYRGSIDIGHEFNMDETIFNAKKARTNLQWWHDEKNYLSERDTIIRYSMRKNDPRSYGDRVPWSEEQRDGLEKALAYSLDRIESCQRAIATNQALKQLPQLFIAV